MLRTRTTNAETAFFYKKHWFLCNSEICRQKVDAVQILGDTIKLDEHKTLAKFFVPRNSKTLNVEKLSKHSCSAPCFSRGTFAVVEKGRQGEKAVVIKKFYTSFSNDITKVFA